MKHKNKNKLLVTLLVFSILGVTTACSNSNAVPDYTLKQETPNVGLTDEQKRLIEEAKKNIEEPEWENMNTFLSTAEFMQKYPVSSKYQTYAVDVVNLAKSGKIGFAETIKIENTVEYKGEFVDAIRVKDGWVAVGINTEKTTGLWKFESLQSIYEAVK